MKKLLFSVIALITMNGTTLAQSGNALTVANIALEQDNEATLTVDFQFDGDNTYTGYQFQCELPSDLAFVMDEGTEAVYTKGNCHDNSYSVVANLSDGLLKVAGLSLSSKPLTGTSGMLLSFKIKPVGTLSIGNSYTGSIKNIIIVPETGTKKQLAASNFTVTIKKPSGISTGINEVDSKTSNKDNYYNLAGQRIHKTSKGIYIKNNKKVILK